MSAFAALVDWGTTSFRLWLVDRDGAVLSEIRSDEGMMKARESGFADVLERHLAGLGAPAALPVVICGMAGARQGWVEAAYMDMPAALRDLARHAVRVDAARPVHILPGLAQRDPAFPDVMRGEETQLLGAVAAGHASGLVCMPGTHSKWVAVEDGRVERFATFMTGDIFSAIAGHSILKLALDGKTQVDPSDPAFARAIEAACARPQEATARLFAIRAGPLLDLGDPAEAAAVLSGELIGLEIAGARSRFGMRDEVALVGSGGLGALYRAALEAVGVEVRMVDADEAVRAGLYAAATALAG